ncbi:MAG: hypothetical protein V1929_00530 [bacterium]
MALALLISPDAGAQEATNSARTIFSTSRRFVVQGLGAEDASAIAQWTEEVSRRLESLVGRPVPVKGHQPLELVPRSDAGGAARVITAQGYVDGQVRQRLVLVNPGALDQEDLLEGLCRLLLNRYVIALQSSRQRAANLGNVPDWMAVGAAQTLYHEIRTRNARMMLARWKTNQAFPLGAILSLQNLPGGRWNEKALCGLMMGWLATWPDARPRWGRMFERLAAGQRIDDAWMASSAAYGSARDMNKAWDVWLAHQCVQHDWARGPVQRLYDLKQVLRVNPDDYGVAVERDVAVPLAPAAMIDLRKRTWMDALTARVALKIQWLAIGQPAELQDVVRGYVAFMNALAARAPAYRGGLFGRGPSESQLREMLAEADAALAGYERDAVQRKDYLDSVAVRLDATGAATWNGLAVPAGDPQDEERRAYLDGLELRTVP